MYRSCWKIRMPHFVRVKLPLLCFNAEISIISLQLQVSVSAPQRTHRDHLSNYTKVALTPLVPRRDQMPPLSLFHLSQSLRHLAKQKQHRLWLLCDFAGTAGREAVSSLSGPASHMTLSGCENAAIAWMLSWVFHSLWLMCHHFTHLAVDNWLPALMGSRVMAWLEWPLHHFLFEPVSYVDVKTRWTWDGQGSCENWLVSVIVVIFVMFTFGIFSYVYELQLLLPHYATHRQYHILPIILIKDKIRIWNVFKLVSIIHFGPQWAK